MIGFIIDFVLTCLIGLFILLIVAAFIVVMKACFYAATESDYEEMFDDLELDDGYSANESEDDDDDELDS